MVGITGYSLTGLFAVYAIYRTDVFSGGHVRFCVVSGIQGVHLLPRAEAPAGLYILLSEGTRKPGPAKGNQDPQLGSEKSSREYGRNSELLLG